MSWFFAEKQSFVLKLNRWLLARWCESFGATARGGRTKNRRVGVKTPKMCCFSARQKCYCMPAALDCFYDNNHVFNPYNVSVSRFTCAHQQYLDCVFPSGVGACVGHYLCILQPPPPPPNMSGVGWAVSWVT